MRKEIKQLQVLYAWHEFYKIHQQYDELQKIKVEITEHKDKYKLNDRN